MAKDGTSRGGARIGAGRKPNSFTGKIIEDQNFEIPQFKEYLAMEQKGGGQNYAAQVYNETFQWLKSCGCAELVSPQLIESFAQATARHIQAESSITQTGFLARHPTTGEPIPSPLVRISLDYLKAAQQAWYTIQQIVNEHAADTGNILTFIPYGGELDE